MDINEFSDRFDTLLNSYSGKEIYGDTKRVYSIEFNEYQKSAFLTQAQDNLVLQLYRKFESSEEIRQYLRTLVTNHTTDVKVITLEGISELSTFFEIPDSTMFILNCNVNLNDKIVSALPITHDEFYLQIENPYRKPTKEHAWRMDYKNIEDKKVIEIIAEPNVSNMSMRYLRRPQPIILTDLGELSINKVSTESECELTQDLHDEILNMAVGMAIQTMGATQPKEQNVSNQ